MSFMFNPCNPCCKKVGIGCCDGKTHFANQYTVHIGGVPDLTNSPGGPYDYADFTNFNGTFTCQYMGITSVPFAFFLTNDPPPGCLWYKIIAFTAGEPNIQDVVFVTPGLNNASILVGASVLLVRIVWGTGIFTGTLLSGSTNPNSLSGDIQAGTETASFSINPSFGPRPILPSRRECEHICYTGADSSGMVNTPTVSNTLYITITGANTEPSTLYGSFAMNYVIDESLWRSVIPDIPTSGSFCLYYFEFRCNKFSYLFTIWEASDFNPIWHIINGPTVISPTGFFPLFLHTNITFASVCGNLSPDQFAEVHITS
jgi:hypothetical protein